MIRKTLRPLAGLARRVTLRLTGFAELRAQLDRQDVALRTIEGLLREVAAGQGDLRAREERRSIEDRSARLGAEQRLAEVAATLRERLDLIAREHSAFRAESAAAFKAAEANVAKAIAEEVDRLDGYLNFHAAELGRAVASLGPGSGADGERPPTARESALAKAG